MILKKGGPRAPPRNKMALYEQLSVPSQSLNEKKNQGYSIKCVDTFQDGNCITLMINLIKCAFFVFAANKDYLVFKCLSFTG
ncbi:hypothetical protein LXL04_010926 [Taraxacum kok-saghyz]